VSSNELYAFTIHFRVRRGYTGSLVGQCKEFPAVIVQGKTLLDIRDELLDGLEGYLKTFSERRNEMVQKYAVLIQNADHKKQMDQKILEAEENLQKQQEDLEQQEEPIGEEWQEQELEQVISVPT
jgi:predicted RNase H-like HicB family nuclease